MAYKPSTIKELLAQNKGWLVCFFVSLFYTYQFMIRVSPSVMNHELMQSFQVSATALGILMSTYYIAYAPLQIPLGLSLDRWGPQRIVIIAILLCSIGCFIFSVSTNIPLAMVGRFFMGAGSACAFMSCLKVATLWLRPKQLSIAAGFTMMLGTFGAVSAGAPLAILIKSIGWRSCMMVLGGIGLLLMGIIWFALKKTPHNASSSTWSKESVWSSFSGVLRNPQCWLIAICNLFLYTPMTVFGDMWGVPFLMNKYQLSCQDAAMPTMFLYVGIAVGAPIMGWLSNALKSRKIPLFFASTSTAIIFSWLLYGEGVSLSMTKALILTAGFFLGGQTIAFTVICEQNPLHRSGTASGFNNTICMLSGLLLQPFVGKILDCFWDQQCTPDMVRIYSAESFCYGLTIIPVCALIAILFLLFIKETYRDEEA